MYISVCYPKALGLTLNRDNLLDACQFITGNIVAMSVILKERY